MTFNAVLSHRLGFALLMLEEEKEATCANLCFGKVPLGVEQRMD